MRTSRWTPASADEQAVGVLAGDRERRALQPGLFAGLIVDHLALEAAALRPAQVHAQQHLGPVLRLGAAGAGMNRDDGVLAIVLAAEHLLDLAGLHFLVERVERLRELGVDRLARLRPFDEHGEIVALLLERHDQIAILLEPAAALQDLLGFGLVFPEIGRGGARLEAGQFFVGRAASKIAPQIGSAFAEILVAAHQLVDGRHARPIVTRRRLDRDATRAARRSAAADA